MLDGKREAEPDAKSNAQLVATGNRSAGTADAKPEMDDSDIPFLGELMQLTTEQNRKALAEHCWYVTEACDRCGKLLGCVRYTRRGEPGEWCSELCRDGSAEVHTRQARRVGRPRLKLSAKGRVLRRRKQVREAAQRHRLRVIKNGRQPIEAKPVTDAILSSGYTPSRAAISPVVETLR